MTGIRGSSVACGIARGDAGGDITVSSKNCSRNVHTPGFTVRIHGCLIGFGTDFDGNRIARFHFIANLPGDRNRLAGFAGVNHVIAGDIVDRYRCGWRDGIHAVSVAGVRGRDIACRIACRDRRTHITVSSQYRTGNIHAPGLAVGIDGDLVGFGTDFYGNRIARFDFIADLTGDRNRLAGLSGVDDII